VASLVAVAFQETVEFSLQMPANAALLRIVPSGVRRIDLPTRVRIRDSRA